MYLGRFIKWINSSEFNGGMPFCSWYLGKEIGINRNYLFPTSAKWLLKRKFSLMMTTVPYWKNMISRLKSPKTCNHCKNICNVIPDKKNNNNKNQFPKYINLNIWSVYATHYPFLSLKYCLSVKLLFFVLEIKFPYNFYLAQI